MRFGVVTTSYPRDDGDPAGCFVGEHVAWLRAQGHEVEVIAAGEVGGRDAGGVIRVHGRGLFYGGGAPEALEAGGRLWPAARVTAAMLARVVARSRRWDGAIAHWLVPPAVVCAVARSLPLVAVAHSGDVHLLCRTGLARATAAVLAARRARLVFVSAELRARFAGAVGARLAGWVSAMPVCAMGVDVGRLRRARRGDGDREGAVFLGRLVPIKGVDVLIDAARRAGVGLTVAGDGPERAALERRAGRGAGVDWLGEVRGDRRDQLLGRARVVVVPSVPRPGGRSEGAPRVALEAMAAGAPLVASATGGLAELPGDAVTLVAPGDAGALAGALTRLVADAGRRAVQVAAADRFVGERDWSKVGPRLLPA